MEFCKQFNVWTQDKPGKICPVQITVYKDKSFDFVVNLQRSTSYWKLQLKSGSGEPNRKVASVTWELSKQLLKTNGRFKFTTIECYEHDCWTARSGYNCIRDSPLIKRKTWQNWQKQKRGCSKIEEKNKLYL
jgi:large subunit ribosomal protein L11